jgi:hypothetical protein
MSPAPFSRHGWSFATPQLAGLVRPASDQERDPLPRRQMLCKLLPGEESNWHERREEDGWGRLGPPRGDDYSGRAQAA